MRKPWLIIGVAMGLVAYAIWEPAPSAENRKLYPAEIYVCYPCYFAVGGLLVGLLIDIALGLHQRFRRPPKNCDSK